MALLLGVYLLAMPGAPAGAGAGVACSVVAELSTDAMPTLDPTPQWSRRLTFCCLLGKTRKGFG